MAYNKFSYKTVEEKLGISLRYDDVFFRKATPLAPDPLLLKLLTPSLNFPLNTEQARREWIIVNVFREWIQLSGNAITIYAAEVFDVEPTLGLTGEADYIITLGRGSINVNDPIIAVAEAKHEKLLTGIGQCIAEMYASRLFNERKGKPTHRTFGVVTTGLLWGFLVMEENQVKMDTREYTLDALDEILGILVYMTQNVG